MTDTPIRLATCVRCHAYVFAADSSGVRTAADPAPVTRDTYVATLVAGRRLFDLTTAAGRPHRLRTRTKLSPAPQFDAQGLQRPPGGSWRQILAEHGCPSSALSAVLVEEVPQAPAPSPCDAWTAQGWDPPATCPRRQRGVLFGAPADDDGGLPVSCSQCEPPPFVPQGLNSDGLPTPAESPDTPEAPSTSQKLSPGVAAWQTASPMASAARPGPARPAPTVPAATKPSAPTGRPTCTAQATSPALARTLPPAGSSSAQMAYGATPATTAAREGPTSSSRSADDPFCDSCRRYIRDGEPFTGIHYVTWQWAYHQTCPAA